MEKSKTMVNLNDEADVYKIRFKKIQKSKNP